MVEITSLQPSYEVVEVLLVLCFSDIRHLIVQIFDVEFLQYHFSHLMMITLYVRVCVSIIIMTLVVGELCIL